jgi:DNA-binding winged helix-turn-helix (wHTH) protein
VSDEDEEGYIGVLENRLDELRNKLAESNAKVLIYEELLRRVWTKQGFSEDEQKVMFVDIVEIRKATIPCAT